MKELLALTINGTQIPAPRQIPTGGSETLIAIGRNSVVLVLILATALCLILMIWGGIMWITSQGDAQKINKARMRIMYAIFGLILVFSSFMIVQFIGNIFKQRSVSRPGSFPPSVCTRRLPDGTCEY